MSRESRTSCGVPRSNSLLRTILGGDYARDVREKGRTKRRRNSELVMAPWRNLARACASGTLLWTLVGSTQVIAEEDGSRRNGGQENKAAEKCVGTTQNGLPTFRMEEVAKHDGKKDRSVWVTYKDGVYDITQFIDAHPGGREKISLAAGKAVDPYWKIYIEPHAKPGTLDVLESMRIGNVDEEDRKKHTSGQEQGKEKDGDGQEEQDPFFHDPPRHPALEVHSSKPCNAEAPSSLLLDSFITPNDLFFVRNHLPVPKVDLTTYALTVEVPGQATKIFSMDRIRNDFEKVSVTMTLQCAGNRRADFDTVKPARGLPWRAAAISNAEWSGVRLRDILLASGMKESDVDSTVHHIQFEGLDTDPAGDHYGASIPVAKAIDERGDVILAYEMNGQPIPLDHGGPLRAIVPGIIGARNVKWVGRVIASEEESPSFWQQHDYKVFPPHVTWENVAQNDAPAIQESPVQSAILVPSPGAAVSAWDTELEVRGFAFSGGGRSIHRVEVSVDGGQTWSQAELLPRPAAPYNRDWAWSLWRVLLPMEEVLASSTPAKETREEKPEADVSDGVKSVRLLCRAVDSSNNMQPEHPQSIWNLRGLLCSSWHEVEIHITEN